METGVERIMHGFHASDAKGDWCAAIFAASGVALTFVFTVVGLLVYFH